MTDVTENGERTIKTIMFGRKTGRNACTACVDTHEYWKRRERRSGGGVQYRYVSSDSAVGKKWLKRNKIADIPASKICTTKNGKTRCNVYVGAMPGAKRLKI